MSKFIFGSAIALVCVSSAFARPEQNAFINRPANTIPELIEQLKADPVVMDRFTRHFSMSRAEVLSYVRSLRLGTIKTSGYYTIYSIPPNGVVKSHQSFFKAGTPAFVDANGDPILRVKCGNPFVRGPRSLALVPDAAPVVAVAPGFEPVATADPTPEEVAYTFVAKDVEAPGDEVLVVPPTYDDNGPVFNTQGIASGLAALVPVGAALAFTNGGGNRQPVPEPTSLLVLGAGSLVVAARRRRRK